ncbi:hypothetical protein E2C01_080257 [Portunus trituberculatus]|uniref:Uncharacterized protein n=1 Tax=Portunus trituberculatus TaxID=210409 RepID=A0A5B7ITL5_PORTR|nr:hypothetical protein [Portunus trituberculatus]
MMPHSPEPPGRDPPSAVCVAAAFWPRTPQTIKNKAFAYTALGLFMYVVFEACAATSVRHWGRSSPLAAARTSREAPNTTYRLYRMT